MMIFLCFSLLLGGWFILFYFIFWLAAIVDLSLSKILNLKPYIKGYSSLLDKKKKPITLKDKKEIRSAVKDENLMTLELN